VRHYQGFARGRRRRLAEPEPTVKHLLYAYRVLLTGIHLMRTGQVVANLGDLNEEFRIEAIAELVARKRAGAETMRLTERDLTRHIALLDRLEASLQHAHEASRLPDEAPSTPALDDFVIRLRLAEAKVRET
jgi:predicted nucleotidyltransferase